MTQPPDDRQPPPWDTPGEPAPTEPAPEPAQEPPPADEAAEATPAEEQPTVAWTPAPPPPAGPPAGSGWTQPPATPPTPAGPPAGSGWTQPAPTPPPAGPPAGSGWTQPPATPPTPVGAGWGQPPATPPPPPAPPAPGTPPGPDPTGGGPILSATPTAPLVGWTQPGAGMVEVAPGLSYAGVASRFVAYVVDAFILGIVSAIIAGIFAASLGFGRTFTAPDGFQNRMVGDPIFSLVSIALGAAYFILSWSGGRRATPGQRLLNIQVGNAPDGRPLTTEQAARRWLGLGVVLGLLAFLPGLIGAASGLQLLWALVLLITTAMSPTKQGLHDRFANSMVVRPTNAGNGVVMACLVIVILLIVLSFVALIGLIAVGSQVSDILRQVGESV